ncbi:Glycosyltransferase involved in cell wall bisynthesis [Butyrivibrio sp. INlla18]|uniref:glycosyltransferase family 4 protein n=1 Tax=Butyrivibrio sp. INlla18 TaxID=1520806 RepID=UPI000886D330|nr:glycosyltransferase family 4 protein [Butyrivibrio sp. INlla18]SDA61048.1 Glycosyltransferase involved in cell wall bisynthesis [Butyrivibrio sp. INlla18]
MNILFIVERDTKYGAAFSGKTLVRGLIQKGHNVVIMVPSSMVDISFYSEIGCKVVKLPYYYFMEYHGKKTGIRNILRCVFKKFQHDAGNLITCTKIRKIMNSHSFDLIHCNSSRIDIGAELAKRYGIPLIWHLREPGRDRVILRKNHIHYMNSHATKFIAVSEYVRKKWIEWGLDQNKIVRIYNGVSFPSVNTQADFEDEVVKFVMTSGFIPRKGHEEVIGAVKDLNNKDKVIVDFYGDGDAQLIRDLKTLVKEYKLENTIRFMGYRKNVIEELPDYHCGLMCSSDEGFGRTTAEYMAAGLCVIASDSGANPELVDNLQNGLLYKNGDSKDLCEKMQYLIDNVKVMAKLGDNAKKKAMSYFTEEKYFSDISDLYELTISGRYGE